MFASIPRITLLLLCLVCSACEVEPGAVDDVDKTGDAANAPDSTAASATPPSVRPAATSTPAIEADEPDPAVETWTVIRVIDGDTLEVESAEGIETIRIVGIDAPESGQCGFEDAADTLARHTLGKQVDLVAGAVEDRDRYARLLRYVDVEGEDAGLELIRGGFAIARYDSRDGYGRHEREDAYIAADAASLPVCDEPVPTATPTQAGLLPSVPGPGDVPVFRNCDALREVYPGGVARLGVPGNISAGVLRPFRIEPLYDDALYEVNRERDGDDDGAACES